MEQIQYIIENFDFHKVRIAMKALKWHWTSCVPTITTLTIMAEDLLYYLVDNPEATEIACGGFRAERKNNTIRLSFCVEELDEEI